jgi:hypothetical protein
MKKHLLLTFLVVFTLQFNGHAQLIDQWTFTDAVTPQNSDIKNKAIDFWDPAQTDNSWANGVLTWGYDGPTAYQTSDSAYQGGTWLNAPDGTIPQLVLTIDAKDINFSANGGYRFEFTGTSGVKVRSRIAYFGGSVSIRMEGNGPEVNFGTIYNQADYTSITDLQLTHTWDFVNNTMSVSADGSGTLAAGGTGTISLSDSVAQDLSGVTNLTGFRTAGQGQGDSFMQLDKVTIASLSVGDAIFTSNSSITTDEVISGDVLVDSGVTLTIKPSGSMDISGTLTNNGTIVMQSSSSSSAALKATSISGSGTYKYQKHVAGSTTNDLITAPFSGETFSSLVGNNSGVLVTNTSPTTEYLFGPFDNDTGAYLTYDSTTNASTVLSAGQGYRAGTASGTTLEFTGSFQTTDQTAAINVGSDGTYGKWNLVGNPFPSYLDLAGFISDNSAVLEDVNTAVYAYDGDDSDGSNWTIYHSSNSSGVAIAPGQAFFVASSSGGGNLNFNTSRQTVTGGDDFLPRQAQTLDSFFKLKLESNNSLTHTDVYFNSNASEGLDIGYDVGTYANQTSSFSLYSKLASGAYSDTKFAVQTISNDLSETVVIPLGVHTSAGENHTISIEDISLLESVNVYLKDYETGTLTLLNNGAYSFSTNSTLEGTSRFELRLANTTLDIESDELVTNFKAVYQNGGVILVGDFIPEDKVEIYDIMGRLTQSHTISGNHSIEITKDELATGVYLAKINRNDSSKTIKFIIN